MQDAVDREGTCGARGDQGTSCLPLGGFAKRSGDRASNWGNSGGRMISQGHTFSSLKGGQGPRSSPRSGSSQPFVRRGGSLRRFITWLP